MFRCGHDFFNAIAHIDKIAAEISGVGKSNSGRKLANSLQNFSFSCSVLSKTDSIGEICSYRIEPTANLACITKLDICT